MIKTSIMSHSSTHLHHVIFKRKMGNKNLQKIDYTLDNTLWKWYCFDGFFSNHKREKWGLSGIFHGGNGIFGGFLGDIFII